MDIFDTKMTAIADEIRELTETEGLLTLDDMKTWLSEVGNNVDTSDATAVETDILSGKTAYVNGEKITGTISTEEQSTPTIDVDENGLVTASSVQETGYVVGGTKSATQQLDTQEAVTITPTKSSQTVVTMGKFTTGDITVGAIPSEYITTTDATAEAGDILIGETAYVNGSKIKGTFTIDNELSEQDDLIAQIQATVDSLPEASGENLETCTVTIRSTNSSYSKITFFEYTTLDSTGKLDVVGVAGQDITSPVSIQCVCNTSISGIFPPSSPNSITFTKMNKILTATAGQVIGWWELTALPNETATITLN